MEVLCIILLINNLPYQKRKLVSMGNAISGKLFKSKTNFTNYFSLKEENQLMMEHNAMLMSKLYINDTTTEKDSVNSKYRFIPANVINKDMGVISSNGIVGKIANVSDNYASVISLLHPYSIVSARFTDNQHIANVSWETTDYRFGTVKDIPLHIIPQKGDTLVTSGFSNIYPADIMIGTIEETINAQSKDFNTAKIRFSTNFSTLRHLYVIENLHQTEIDSLISNK